MLWFEHMQNYTDTSPIKPMVTGPEGYALVHVYPQPEGDPKTQPGWGLVGSNGKPGFMENYSARKFDKTTALYQFKTHGSPFALVMRSVQAVCVDIDGKNGGFESVRQGKLGILPPTLAERSKSGNGVHLFYATDEPWHSSEGFNQFRDMIGVAPGVDIRATGCVYHYAGQAWHDSFTALAPVPAELNQILTAAKTAPLMTRAVVAGYTTEEHELAVINATSDLHAANPAPGTRNTTLFALGCKLSALDIPDWEVALFAKATAVGLDPVESRKIISNVIRYA